MGKPKFPASDREIAWAILEVMEDHRRPMAKSDMPLPVAGKLSLHPRYIDQPRDRGSETELQYRIGWVLTKLKNIGAVENVQRGYWALTRVRGELRYRKSLYNKIVAQFGPEIDFRKNRGRNDPGLSKIVPKPKSDPIERLRKLNHQSFEKICLKFLEQSGFSLLTVTEKTRNVFDGNGIIRINFMSFRVSFRCHQFAESIDQSEIRAFRSTIIGRTEKGLYITTGAFDESAIREAEWDRVPVIELIHGTELCRHLNRLDLRIQNQK